MNAAATMKTLASARPAAPALPTQRDASLGAVKVVRAVLSLPDGELDYARAKLAFDKVVDPTVDVEATLAELNEMAETARRLAGRSASEGERLTALRKFVYVSGAWNAYRAFDYDHADFKNIRVKLIPHYLETRLGNCVSMPILFLILADKLGLDIALAMAPAHFFVRYRDESRRVINLEPTSGALPARDIWIRQTRQVRRSRHRNRLLHAFAQPEGGRCRDGIHHRGAFEQSQALRRSDQGVGDCPSPRSSRRHGLG